ncbi:LysR substrate-binding domain-containing protein, partial [Pseudomonas ficuserectae]
EAGQRFAADCRRLLADLDEAESAAGGLHAVPGGLLTITAPQMFGALHVVPVMTSFLKRFPAVDIRAILVDRVVSMLDEGVDVAVRIGALPDSSLTATPTGSVRRMVCASPAYLEKHGVPQHPDDLRQHSTVSTTTAERPPQWLFRINDNNYSVDVASRLSLTSYQAAISAALQGWGLTQVPYYQIRGHLQEGRLKCVLETFEITPEPVHVVYLEGRRRSSKVRAFVDFCVSALRHDLQFEHQ